VEAQHAEGEGEGTGGGWNWALVEREAPELVPYHPSAEFPSLHGATPEHVERKLSGQLRIPPGGVLCGGVLSTTAPTDDGESGEGLTDVYFLAQSPPPAKPGKIQTPQILLQCVVLSVPAEEGQALAAEKNPGAVRKLFERLGAGEISCAAQAAVVIRHGQRGSSECLRYVQQPGEYVPSAVAPNVMIPHSWGGTGCGISLAADYSGDAGKIVVDGTLEWDTAPVSGFGEPGATVPDMPARRCVQKIALENVALQRGQPFLADVRASNAREGTTEHGRWHVLVLLAR
jgi:hypothetical protein